MTPQAPHQSNVHCIWMDAGVTGFKLCDRDLDCERCPFDEIMRRPNDGNESGEIRTRPSRPGGIPASSGEAERILHSLFSSIDLSLFPDDRSYHRGHLWMQKTGDGIFTLGLDHVAGAILGSISSIVLPQLGTRLVQKAPWCWLIHHEGALSLYSPIHGVVVETNDALLEHPEYAIVDPYRLGWILRARPEPTKSADTSFVDRTEYWPIVQSEIRTMRARFAQHLKKGPAIGPTMMDGGRAVETLCAMTGRTVYLAIVSSMFAP